MIKQWAIKNPEGDFIYFGCSKTRRETWDCASDLDKELMTIWMGIKGIYKVTDKVIRVFESKGYTCTRVEIIEAIKISELRCLLQRGQCADAWDKMREILGVKYVCCDT